MMQRSGAIRGGRTALQARSGLNLPLFQTDCRTALSVAGWRSSAWKPVLRAGKGFGTTTPRKEDTDDAASSKPRMRQVRKQMSQAMPSQMQREQLQRQAFQQAVDVQRRALEEQENSDFAARLLALKAQGEEKRMSLPAASVASASPAPAPGAGGGAADGRVAFDQPAASIYDNPPSLQDTVLSQLNSDISDPKLKNAQIGPSQLGIAASAVVFGLVFVLVAGGDFAPNTRFKGVRPALDAPDSLQQGIIKTRISQLEEQLRLTPNNPESTQALALSYAQLFQFDKAADLLDKLVDRQPNLADAWRLLGETSLLGEQAGRSVRAYERAVALRDDDLQIATGLVDAYIANGQQAKAIEYIQQLKAKLPPAGPPGPAASAPTVLAPATSATDGAEGASPAPPQAEASQPSTSTPAAAAGKQQQKPQASRAIRPLEPVSLDLLLAKTYSQWRGHDNDALATYDALIAAFPEDFRGYLAKGIFLRDKGRRADAERMFLQARFYAPNNRQRFVKDTVDSTPVVDLPENN